MGINVALREELPVLATIDPASYSAGANNTDVIDMKNVRRVMFIIQTGVLGSSATLDFEIDGDTASGGSFSTKITGKSITQIVKASGDNVQSVIEVTAEEVAAQGFRYIRGKGTVGTAASIYGVVAIGGELTYRPASDYDLSSSTVMNV